MTDALSILNVNAPDAESCLLDYGKRLHTYLLDLRSSPTMSDRRSLFNGSQLALAWRDRYLYMGDKLGTTHAPSSTVAQLVRLPKGAQTAIERIAERLSSRQECVLLCAQQEHGEMVARLVRRVLDGMQSAKEMEV